MEKIEPRVKVEVEFCIPDVSLPVQLLEFPRSLSLREACLEIFNGLELRNKEDYGLCIVNDLWFVQSRTMGLLYDRFQVDSKLALTMKSKRQILRIVLLNEIVKMFRVDVSKTLREILTEVCEKAAIVHNRV
jgi:hypothetical protein